jgi:hypothetical protein
MMIYIYKGYLQHWQPSVHGPAGKDAELTHETGPVMLHVAV